MASRRVSSKDLRAAASDIGPGDGQDPRYDRLPSGRQPGRKTLQLCGQVMQTLSGVLAEQADDVLRDLLVLSVTPAGGGRMLARVALAPSAAARDAAVLLDHLARAHGLLRSEVAAAIHRRKAPDLVFEVVPAGTP